MNFFMEVNPKATLRHNLSLLGCAGAAQAAGGGQKLHPSSLFLQCNNDAGIFSMVGQFQFLSGNEPKDSGEA
jgi:hypothetical protein